MKFEQELEDRVKAIILDVVITLNRHGIRAVPVGAIMRMLGVPNDIAENYDNEIVEVTDALTEIIDNGLDELYEPPPPGTTFH